MSVLSFVPVERRTLLRLLCLVPYLEKLCQHASAFRRLFFFSRFSFDLLVSILQAPTHNALLYAQLYCRQPSVFKNGVTTPVLNFLVPGFEYLFLRHTDHQCKISGAVPVLPHFIVSPYFFCRRIVLANLLCGQIYAVPVKYSELFFLSDMKIDLLCQQLGAILWRI